MGIGRNKVEINFLPLTIHTSDKMQPFCQNTQLSRSLESELENAVKTGELKLSSKNLKDFPKHGERYNLQDTILAGTLYSIAVMTFTLVAVAESIRCFALHNCRPEYFVILRRKCRRKIGNFPKVPRLTW